MKKIIVCMLFLVSIAVNAQKITELNSDLYKVNLWESLLTEIQVLKRNSVKESYKPTKLKRGTYSLNIQKDIVFTFFINRRQVITKGKINGNAKNKKFRGVVKKGIFRSIKGYAKDKLIYLGKVNTKDSIFKIIQYYKNGKTKKEITEFFTAKNFEKKITTTYNEDGSYSIENQINKTLKKFNAKGELIATEKNDTSAKEVIEDKKEKE